jgi:hypothetical protein
MSSASHVGANSPGQFGRYAIASARGVSLGSTGNAVANLAVLGGGLSNSGSTATSGQAIARQIVVRNPSANVSTTTISIGYSSDGANLWANNQSLSTLTAVNKYQDLVLSATANTTCLNGNVSSVLYVNVNSNAVANAVCDIYVFGEIVNP